MGGRESPPGVARCPPPPAPATPTLLPLSPGSSRPPLCRPSTRPGVPAQWRQLQRAPPPERPPWPASPRRAPLRELSGESGHNTHHHGFRQLGPRPVLGASQVNNPTHHMQGLGPSSWLLSNFTDRETEAQREVSWPKVMSQVLTDWKAHTPEAVQAAVGNAIVYS